MSRHMRTTVRLNDDLLRRAKKAAADQKTTLTALIERSLQRELKQPAEKRRAKVRLPVWSGGKLRAGVDLNNSKTLLDVMERE